jgi:NAD(P)-dependent dehydrogenase (short-subunit alcohol dehydrogenase family)
VICIEGEVTLGKSIVITGSTRGIGYGLADAFLARGCSVTINGRSDEHVQSALEDLTAKYGLDHISGQSGDVSHLETHEMLWHAAVARHGRVDIWINNAGLGHPVQPVWDLPAETVYSVVNVNLLGLIYGSQVAIRGMLEQGHGQLYNMEGFGSNGRTRTGLTVYGTTKAAVRYLNKALVAESKDTPVQIVALSPGMIITELLTGQFEDDPEGLQEAKRVFNILGDKPETVTPWLADRVLANDRSGSRIAWLTTPKIMWRFATAPFTKRDLFDESKE